MISHIQSEFEGGIKWGYAKAQRQHIGAEHKGTMRRPSVKFKHKWGGMIKFDKEGGVMSPAVLSAEPEWPLHAMLFVYPTSHIGHSCTGLTPLPPTLSASCNISTLWGCLDLSSCVITGIGSWASM